MIKKIIALSAITCVLISSTEAAIERRAAFDCGSGKLKVQVADVDTESHEILSTLYVDSKIVRLSADLVHQLDGTFSQQIQETALAAAQELKQKAIKHGATQFCGIATEAYRVASNSQQLIDRFLSELSLPVTVISQEDEGKLGFLALIKEQELDPAKVITWDIGGGSFQITYLDRNGQLQVYKGPFGRTTVMQAIIANVKHLDPKQVATPNPMSQENWDTSVDYIQEKLSTPPQELIEQLKKPGVELIGIGAHPEKLRSYGTYSIDDLRQLIADYLNKTDEQLAANAHQAPAYAVSELVLLYSLIQSLEVDHVTYIRTQSGSSSALLTSEAYWQ